MKAIQVKCPSCGASLNVGPEVDTVTCEYCSTQSVIRRRSGIFQRLESVPQPPAGAEAAPPHPTQVAVQTRAKAAVIGMVLGGLIPVFLAVVLPVTLCVSEATAMWWEGIGGLLLAHVNGDTVEDVVGRVRYYNRDDQIAIAAFDGATGDQLWESEFVGKFSDHTSSMLALCGDKLLLASGQGALQAFALQDGSRLWQTELGEKPQSFCGSADRVTVTTADGQGHTVMLASGTDGEPSRCADLPHDRKGGDPLVRPLERDFWNDRIAGMNVGEVLGVLGGGPEVLLGYRDKGTAIPMVAVRGQDGAVLWKGDVPGSEPLRAQENNPEEATLTAERVYVVYKRKESDDPPRLAAFKLATGERLFEVPLQSTEPVSAVQASRTHLFVSAWYGLEAFDPLTGEHLYLIGSRALGSGCEGSGD